MSKYAGHVSTRVTPQTEKVFGRTDQVLNSAGGFVFAVDDWTRLDRFLVLGAEGGTYYASEAKLTRENAECVARCLAADTARTVARIVEMSVSGRIPKNATAIFGLALACGLETGTRPNGAKTFGFIDQVIAQDAVNKVCRTANDFFQFIESVKSFRGLGKKMQFLIGNWYGAKTVEQAAFQVTKYVQRNGVSHRDVLRQCGGAPVTTPAHGALYRWVSSGGEKMGSYSVDRTKGGGKVTEYPAVDPALLPRIVHAYEAVKKATSKAEILKLIQEDRVPREFLEGAQSKYLNDPEVWEALLPSMPLTALVRNLGKMSAIGLITPLSAAEKLVKAKLGDQAYIKKSRLHPIWILVNAKTYGQGRGVKGSLSWSPTAGVKDALDAAFFLAFGNVIPSGKGCLLALDVSGSMGGRMSGFSDIAGTSVSPREAAAALALVTARTEPNYHIMGFQDKLVDIPITARTSLTDAVRLTENLPFGRTDCALPMTTALEKKWSVEAFSVYTDNETYAGSIHPFQALKQYRHRMGGSAKLCVVGMTATQFTIADPTDAGMLDVVGFDTAAPQIMADFFRGGDASVTESEEVDD
jgi:60 kDa SS-A/Ro ribonucleoprotein